MGSTNICQYFLKVLLIYRSTSRVLICLSCNAVVNETMGQHPLQPLKKINGNMTFGVIRVGVSRILQNCLLKWSKIDVIFKHAALKTQNKASLWALAQLIFIFTLVCVHVNNFGVRVTVSDEQLYLKSQHTIYEWLNAADRTQEEQFKISHVWRWLKPIIWKLSLVDCGSQKYQRSFLPLQ